jgi:hypothetical protein
MNRKERRAAASADRTGGGEAGPKTDLDGWHRFEAENPETFAAMYQF